MPALPLRDIIVFPHMVSQLFVGRKRSIAALDAAMAAEKEVFLIAQKVATTDDPTPEEIYEVGTVGTIVQLLRLADGTVKVLVEGRTRAKVRSYTSTEEHYSVEVEALPDTHADALEIEALTRSLQSIFEVYVKLNRKVQSEVVLSVQSMDNPSKLADTIAANLPTLKLSQRHELLALADVKKRLETLYQLIQSEVEILQVEKKIRSRVKKQMERSQKEFYLNEQMQAIQKELGSEKDELKSELDEVTELLQKKSLSIEARERVEKELRKLKQMHPTSAEATVVRNYVDWIVSLPWGQRTEERFDLNEAEAILDEDHFGLEKCKERIVEYLAVQALTGALKSPIICLVGPPGVGKTSIAKSIARATNREFIRLSLGGVRDEAEIRGHRRTYIGALPGKLIQSLKKVGKQNPVMLLDEIDKMSTDFRGDPASALLEVLDPEQNKSFNDHYLDLDYDLSEVMFITTANTLSGIPLPLMDRMEIIELSSYTDIEKLAIAKKYLVARNQKECGLESASINLEDDALLELIHRYTREAGVRSLDRKISAVLRKLALELVKEHGPLVVQRRQAEAASPVDGDAAASRAEEKVEEAEPLDARVSLLKNLPALTVSAQRITKLLGPPEFDPDLHDEPDLVGLTHGLAYTTVGGTLLDCEASVVPGKGKLVITGRLEKGMQESAQAAMSYIRSRADALGLDSDFYETRDIHVHFPNFSPKDGPSAGVTVATTIASALTQSCVRHDLAMTGEITLRGRVMPIGGVKEKLMAAHRAGMKTVLVPIENKRHLKEVPKEVKSSLRIVLIRHMDEVLSQALLIEEAQGLPAVAQPVVTYDETEEHQDENDEFELSTGLKQSVPQAPDEPRPSVE